MLSNTDFLTDITNPFCRIETQFGCKTCWKFHGREPLISNLNSAILDDSDSFNQELSGMRDLSHKSKGLLLSHLPNDVLKKNSKVATLQNGESDFSIHPVSAEKLRRVYLVGICGSGMKALAEYLSDFGSEVFGSDLTQPQTSLKCFQEKGIRIHFGHHVEDFPENIDCLIYSGAVDQNNPERQHASKLGIPQYSYSQMLGCLMCDKTGVAISGTHGKSTTTAMTASILKDTSLSPSAIFGAQLKESGMNGWSGSGDLFIAESCEYKRSFLNLNPRYAVILGIEPDHFDCFSGIADIEQTFSDFSKQVSPDGVLLVNSDCETSINASQSASAKIETFSCAPHSDWWAADIRTTDQGHRFRVFYQGDYFTEIDLRIPGKHNILNALASAALSYHSGASKSEIREGLRNFEGIRRRYEHVGSWRGVTLIDDYAHHPTAVRKTLETARAEFGQRRIWCLFQPHQTSRTKALMDEFAASFEQADKILIAPVFAAREENQEEAIRTSQQLSDKISLQSDDSRYYPSLDQILLTLEDETRPGDVLITMGAGNIDQVYHELIRRIQRNYQVRRTAGASHLVKNWWSSTDVRRTA